jgi:predicted nuclease of predicted toxin-antitoxin system
MRFLADMGVSMRVVEWLRSSGHDAIHLRDESLQKLPNGEIFRKGIRENRIVLTFDLDFGEIVAGSGGVSGSVILFRLGNTRSDFVIQRLETVLKQSTTVFEEGAVVVLVEDGRHRVRRLPIGK